MPRHKVKGREWENTFEENHKKKKKETPTNVLTNLAMHYRAAEAHFTLQLFSGNAPSSPTAICARSANHQFRVKRIAARDLRARTRQIHDPRVKAGTGEGAGEISERYRYFDAELKILRVVASEYPRIRQMYERSRDRSRSQKQSASETSPTSPRTCPVL